jgi:hypothetical protein
MSTIIGHLWLDVRGDWHLRAWIYSPYRGVLLHARVVERVVRVRFEKFGRERSKEGATTCYRTPHPSNLQQPATVLAGRAILLLVFLLVYLCAARLSLGGTECRSVENDHGVLN